VYLTATRRGRLVLDHRTRHVQTILLRYTHIHIATVPQELSYWRLLSRPTKLTSVLFSLPVLFLCRLVQVTGGPQRRILMSTAETGILWARCQTDRRRLAAFEMWISRRMEKIGWLDKVTNEEVLRRVNEGRQMPGNLRIC